MTPIVSYSKGHCSSTARLGLRDSPTRRTARSPSSPGLIRQHYAKNLNLDNDTKDAASLPPRVDQNTAPGSARDDLRECGARLREAKDARDRDRQSALCEARGKLLERCPIRAHIAIADSNLTLGGRRIAGDGR